VRVSEIGFGTWGIGKTAWVGAIDSVSVDALKTARELGINFFDTALLYGDGHSERLLAQAFGNADDVVIASKVPGKVPAKPGKRFAEVYPLTHVQGCLDTTLLNLNRDAIDLYQFHGWSEQWADDPDWHDCVEKIRGSGKARFIGISVNHHEPNSVLPALATGLVDSVQVIYNIFDQAAQDKLLPYCHEHQIGVIARVPFDEGALTGSVTPQTTFPAGDFRNWYFVGERKQQVWGRVQRLLADAAIGLEELPEFALRFCLSHPAIAAVIPGMRTVNHVRNNVPASDQGPLDAALLERLQQHRWLRNFYRTSITEKLQVFSSAPLSEKITTILKRFGRG